MTPSYLSRPHGTRCDQGATAARQRVQPRSTLLIVVAIIATLLLAACGQAIPPGIALSDASVIVPYAYGPGQDVSLELLRTGGFDGEVTVEIDASGLPAGVTISTTTLTFAPGVTEAALTLVSDDTVDVTDLNAAVQLAMNASATDHSSSATLNVEVAAVVMNTDDGGEGSLRYLDLTLPEGAADDLIVVSFDPLVFSAPQTIELASSMTIRNGRHFKGPVNVDGEPLVTIRGGTTATGVISVKPSLVGKFSNLIFENGQGNTNGGAIHNAGVLEIDNSIIRGSDATRGGGIFNQVNAELTLTDTRITGNSADDGGGIFNNGGKISVFDSVIDLNVAAFAGGGIYNGGATVSTVLHQGELFVSGTHIDGNEALNGGGINNTSDGDLTLVRSIISGNDVGVDGLAGGGGIDNQGTAVITFSEISGNKAVFGGGIYNKLDAVLRITGSTIATNVVTSNGGGIFSNGVVEIANSTFANNEAGRGGGLFVSSNAASTAIVAFSTIAGNTASGEGGGLDYSGTLSLRGTIVADNVALTGDGPDVYKRGTGVFNSLGYNLIADATSSGVFGATNLINVDPLLGALQDNGGDTPTMALSNSSPAIDYVAPGDCLDASATPLESDQRGEPRPAGSNCDIGAVEVQ